MDAQLLVNKLYFFSCFKEYVQLVLKNSSLRNYGLWMFWMKKYFLKSNNSKASPIFVLKILPN